MGLSCAGIIMHLGSGVVYLRGTALNPRLAVGERERSQQLPKVYHSGPILMTQNHIASYKTGISESLLTTKISTGPSRRRTHDPLIDHSALYCERVNLLCHHLYKNL
jgi:hypothetical protein